ncbi:hypothetical protein Daura_50420 [Dactylosporangium aurantiacum]|uniref:DUF2568 domain-containing protein n=1 Tax=Dactylosporangium aurantiacum TaxID=35754 RepID=A0A9Q9IDY7_9ACTN|nr:hypothetical protein [Dactylosporangium aurantiacum]MDG6109054.1 hypothetical protein [Dactylosporangium aurantiacum]UWZ54554.1 hypothetical protein Daura_50420 [Dactylosporangium aurantiacum]
MIPALLLTLAVEVPLYVLALTALRLATWRRAVPLGVVVNLLTHPVLWWALAPRPSPAALWTAEAVVVLAEAAMLWLACRRDPAVLLVTSLGANAASVFIGLVR